MPKGYAYTSDVKSIIFQVMKFVESEKEGPNIPLYNVNDRLMAMLNISHGSLVSLKKELKIITEEQQMSTRELRSSIINLDVSESSNQLSPGKRGHRGSMAIILSEEAKNMIRFKFHLLLSENQYPTLRRLLQRLKQDIPDFPINNITTLSKHLKELGFAYKQTSSIKIILDSNYCMAERARYFYHLNKLEQEGAAIYFQDETWLNANEEKKSIWIELATGRGKFRTKTGKGKRLIINALINYDGFYLPSVEIFESDEHHSMNSDHFVNWVTQVSGVLRTELGRNKKICIIMDNAKWHNKQTEYSRIPSRAWNKDRIRDWLEDHQVFYYDHYSKAELLELCHENAPPKKYLVDAAASAFDIQILRLPIQHCMLNPIELGWACMKTFIRDQNTSFNLKDVNALAASWIAACDKTTTAGFFQQVKKYEETFKKADHYTEQTESKLLDTDEECESDLNSTENDSSDDNGYE